MELDEVWMTADDVSLAQRVVVNLLKPLESRSHILRILRAARGDADGADIEPG